MRLTWLGHSAALVQSEAGKVIFDPFLTGNPTAAIKASQVDCDAVLVTHGHSDHVGDAVAIARRLNVPIVTVFELAAVLGWQGAKTHGLQIGGAYTFPFGKVKLTPAWHGTGMVDDARKTMTYTGMPAGILYTAAGKTVFHAGDSGLTVEYELLGRLNAIDVALIPIGGNFTMDAADAAQAVKMLKPKKVVPIHYNTFGLVKADPQEFAKLVGDAAQVEILKPGGSLEV